MSLGSHYRSLLQQRIILDFLYQGIIPSRKEVDVLLQEAIKSNPTLDKTFTSADQFALDLEENSSSIKFNTTIDNLILDLKALYKTTAENGKQATSITAKTLSEFQFLEKQVNDIENSATNILLTANDIEGFAHFVSDSFINTDKIDLSNTTTSIDNKTQVLQLPVSTQNRVVTNLSNSDLQFNVLTRNNLVSNNTVLDSAILNAFIDLDKFWIQNISFLKPPTFFVGELIIHLPKVSKISRLIYKPISSDKGSILNVQLQYSVDGINWINIDGANRRVLTDTIFDFDFIEASYWKLTFNKTGYDEFIGNNYIFELGAKAIEFYGIEYELDSKLQNEAIFISKPLKTDSDFEFNKASLKVCERIPNGTSIDYSLSFLDNTQFTNWQNGSLDLATLTYSDIDPVNRDLQVKPLIVDGAQVSRFQNFDSLYDLDSLTDHKDKDNTNNVLIDTFTLTSTIREDAIQVFRNVGDNTLDGGSFGPVQVNGLDAGWVLINDFYSANFYIDSPSGKIVDFGTNPVEIDNIRSSGRINLSFGRHSIRTHRRNWLTISPSIITSPGDSNPDILYPYNHKYLIEGLTDTLYGVNLLTDLGGGTTRKDIIDPNNLYIPSAKYWANTLKKTSLFDFAFKIEDNNFTVYTVTQDANGDERILIKYDPTLGLFDNEKFAIIEDQITGNLFKYVVLRAFLRTTKISSSPILDSFYIRLGL